MALNLGFDSAGAMTNQPTSIRFKPVHSGEIPVATGAHVPHKRTQNQLVVVTWGLRRSRNATLAELRTIRNSLDFHTIQFTDLASVAHDIKILWPGDPEFTEDHAELLQRLTIEFKQRPG